MSSIKSINDTEDLDSESGVILPDDLTAENLHELNISRDNSTLPSVSKTFTVASMAGSKHAPTERSTTGIAQWQAMSRQNGKENTKPTHLTAYEARSTAHTKSFSSASSTLSDDSNATTTQASRAVYSKPTSKFAKVPTYQRPVPVPEQVGGRNVSYDSDDDGDNDDDVDDYFTI